MLDAALGDPPMGISMPMLMKGKKETQADLKGPCGTEVPRPDLKAALCRRPSNCRCSIQEQPTRSIALLGLDSMLVMLFAGFLLGVQQKGTAGLAKRGKVCADCYELGRPEIS